VKWSTTPAEKEHAEIDTSIVVVRELQVNCAQRDWDAAALDWAEVGINFALMNEVLSMTFLYPFCDQCVAV
jgi:hypothetical protein